MSAARGDGDRLWYVVRDGGLPGLCLSCGRGSTTSSSVPPVDFVLLKAQRVNCFCVDPGSSNLV